MMKLSSFVVLVLCGVLLLVTSCQKDSPLVEPNKSTDGRVLSAEERALIKKLEADHGFKQGKIDESKPVLKFKSVTELDKFMRRFGSATSSPNARPAYDLPEVTVTATREVPTGPYLNPDANGGGGSGGSGGGGGGGGGGSGSGGGSSGDPGTGRDTPGYWRHVSHATVSFDRLQPLQNLSLNVIFYKKDGVITDVANVSVVPVGFFTGTPTSVVSDIHHDDAFIYWHATITATFQIDAGVTGVGQSVYEMDFIYNTHSHALITRTQHVQIGN